MPFIDVAKSIISGYELLTDLEREQFEETAIGRRFTTGINDILKLESETSIWDFFGWTEKKKEAEEKKKKEELHAELQDNIDYEQIRYAIISKVLEQDFPNFALLSPEEKTVLASADFSRILQTQLPPLEEAIREEICNSYGYYNPTIRAQELEKQRDELWTQWLEGFKKSPALATVWHKIMRHEAEQRRNELGDFFPAINADTNDAAAQALYFIEDYCSESRKGEPDYERMQEDFLTQFIFNTLQNAANNKINFINLNNFNIKQSNAIAKKILGAFNLQKSLEIDAWLEDYQADLVEHIRQQLLLINGHKRVIPPKEEYAGILSSLSYLFLHSDTSEKVQDFLKKAADAHAFIQYTGMSTQNEASWGFILDLVNYFRAADQITEVRSILISLFKPFMPLYTEYKDIAFKEKNIYRKLFRALMPLLITAAVVVGIVVLFAAMLSPLAIPEFVFLLIAIPALILGVFLASQYVVLKNVVHNSLRRVYHGGLFEIPEFQVSQRMIHIFGSTEQAEIIRGIYIEEIKLCDEKERIYSERAGNSLLSQDEIEQRKANLKRRYSLNFEWYDIHSNENFGSDKVLEIVAFRLEELFKEAVIQLEKEVAEHDEEQINAYAEQIVDEVKAHWVPVREAENEEEIEAENNGVPAAANPVISFSSSEKGPQFFKPLSLAHQRKAAKLDKVLDFVEDLEPSNAP